MCFSYYVFFQMFVDRSWCVCFFGNFGVMLWLGVAKAKVTPPQKIYMKQILYMTPFKKANRFPYNSGQNKATSHDLGPQNVAFGKGHPRLFQGKLGWWNITNLARYNSMSLSSSPQFSPGYHGLWTQYSFGVSKTQQHQALWKYETVGWEFKPWLLTCSYGCFQK